ncbi:L-lysine 2,3-aminomutase [Colletotrichum orbiculare MAFF 240422]|uniref:L-lysine 2,3-aminomutase n=1 Tax=Colletotrichum orbiculare (strain 104-T / ATCC 96160 / CBS 514.97 / LARS 414 / MAFF 240422) TaxID=1213857 RepID=A0A484G2H1_COLOR|nr:L-lysine 2,3-aminomutase [Colletotrichum orbiculare MAFF 240422]
MQAADAAAAERWVDRYPESAAAVPPRTNDEEFWRRVPGWENVSCKEFMSYRWSTKNLVEGPRKLHDFLERVLPGHVPRTGTSGETEPREQLVRDVHDGVAQATMSVRVMPYTLSRINWSDPRNDPIFRQFIPTKSIMRPDHPKLTLDSLEEKADSPVKGLVHRYPDKALFLPLSVCPTYCVFCTRSYAVGANTDSVTKDSLKPGRARWEEVFSHIERTPEIQDVVVSGGDSYQLTPHHVAMIGRRLISIPHVRRFRFATKGLAVCPTRILDPDDGWAAGMVSIADEARRAGKSMAVHTHFNHPDEISWITERASRRLHEAGVVVRNQSVLLRGVNDDVATMSTLIRRLADNNIFPYYVYQHDMVRNSEHLRTPLQTMLDLEADIRGSIAGFMTPQFVVDLPGGGGKRLASTYESYDRATGVSTFVAPAVTGRGKGDRVYEYHDPVDSVVAAARGGGS